MKPLTSPAAALVVLLCATGCTDQEPADDAADTETTATETATTETPTTESQPTATDGDDGSGTSLSALEECAEEPLPELVEQVAPSVVTVLTPGAGTGSGVVYRDNYVITNQHVVATDIGTPDVVDEVELLLADGSTISGDVVGSDFLTDLAVIEVDRELPPLEFSDELPSAGQTVLALGTPLGFSGSVTEGIVSGLGRELPTGPQSPRPPVVDLIQTDAAISPGNSGGALVNRCGVVVGINESYIPPQAGAVAIGFAIPSVIATDIAEELVAEGVVTHPFLGVRATDLSPQIAESLGTEVQQGAAIINVEQGSPADEAGLQRGDVITSLAGEEVEGYSGLIDALRSVEPDTTVPITLDRGGETVETDIAVGSRTQPG